jgi:hypothetical protein
MAVFMHNVEPDMVAAPAACPAVERPAMEVADR